MCLAFGIQHRLNYSVDATYKSVIRYVDHMMSILTRQIFDIPQDLEDNGKTHSKSETHFFLFLGL